MKITELNPHWIELDGRKLGMDFECPAHRIAGALWFKNPIGGGEPRGGEKCFWDRTGETFETMTLTPSIRFRDNCHGFVRNGEWILV